MSELDSFLTSGTQPPDPGATAPPPAPAPPTPAPTPPAPPPAATEAPEPQPDPEDEIGHDGGMIPASTFHKARADWKGKAVAAETEAKLYAAETKRLRDQLEAIRTPSTPPAPPPPELPLDPARDPVGYHNRVQQVLLNDRLNMSEVLEREKHPPEVFEAAVAEFQAAAKLQPDLFGKLHSQMHPYGWLMKEVEKLRVQRELGDDPAAYRARIVAEERAKWEAEQHSGPAVSPAAGLPPSLAATRSAAPRSSNGFSGPPSLDDIFRREAKRR